MLIAETGTDMSGDDSMGGRLPLPTADPDLTPSIGLQGVRQSLPHFRQRLLIHPHVFPLLDNILTFVEHRVTNALSEGLNSAISTLIRRAYGYRNLNNLITAIYFYQGKLPLFPELASNGDVG